MKHLMMFWFPRFQIDSLTGLGVVKVECGSQFSVALTKSGAVYTWYVQPGDLSRLHWYKRWLVCIPVSCVAPPPGEKGTITAWATAPTTTFDDRAKFRGCRGRRSSPSPQARCTVCAAPRMVGVTVKAPSFYLHTSYSFSFSVLAAILPFGAVKSPQFS